MKSELIKKKLKKKTFAKVFCEILEVLSEQDPSGKKCMRSDKIDSSQWVFEFDKITFFITTFAPFYPHTNSRYSFGVDHCFILFQPEISFARHNLPQDTPHTDWEKPKSVRDKIRVEFRDAGKGYLIRETVNYPMSHDIIKPIGMNDNIIEWWKYKNN